MALSMVTALGAIRTRLATLTGIAEVFAASETGDNAIPPALNSFPAICIFPGPDIEYALGSNAHRHRYEVLCQFFEAGADVGERSASLLPFIDRTIEAFTGHIKLGGVVEYCTYIRQSGFVTIVYAGREYEGYEVVLEVSEWATTTTGV